MSSLQCDFCWHQYTPPNASSTDLNKKRPRRRSPGPVYWVYPCSITIYRMVPGASRPFHHGETWGSHTIRISSIVGKRGHLNR